MEVLEKTVLHDIQKNAKLASADQLELVQRIERYENREQEEKKLMQTKKLYEAKNRLKEVDELSRKLFEERCIGNIPDSIFKKLMSDYEREQKNLKINIAECQSYLVKYDNTSKNATRWVDTISRYTQIDNLTRNVVVELIDSIQVSECYIIDGEKHQDIQINYKFVGCIN